MNNIVRKYQTNNLEQLKDETIRIIKHSLKVLKKNPINNVTNINSSSYIPKLILIGPKEDDKHIIINTVISNLAETFKDNSSKVLSNNEQIIFNIPEELTTNEQAINYWQDIFKVFVKYNSKNPFDGIILTLNLHQLISLPKATKSKINLQLNNIFYLGCSFIRRKIPVFILITGMDTLIGFNEFFKDLCHEDLDSIWGLEINNITSSNSIENEITTAFDKMQKKLEKHLLWKLNSLISPNEISLAYEFPLQFHSILTFITNNLKEIFSANTFCKFNISGIFFISNEKSNNKTDCISQYTQKILSNELSNEYAISPNNNTDFFAKKLILSTIPKQTKNFSLKPKAFIKQSSAKIFAVLLSLFSMLLMSSTVYIYHQDANNINQINNDLVDYRVQLQNVLKKNYELQDLVSLLALLNGIESNFDKLKINKIFKNIFPSLTTIENNITELQKISYKEILLPFIKSEIEKQLLIQMKSGDPAKSFSTLKAYLMLGNQFDFDKDYIIDKLLYILRNNPFLDTENINNLKPLINRSLIDNPMLILEQDIISKYNKILLSKPIMNLVYDIFKEYVNDNPIKNIGIYSSSLFVPDYLKSNNFINYFQNLIPSLSRDFAQIYQSLELPKFDVDYLVKSVQNQYIQGYFEYWEKYISSLLPKIQLNTTDSIEEVLHGLYESTLYLDTAIKLIKENTSPLINTSSAAKVFNHFIADKLQKNTLKFQIADESFGPTFDKIQKYYNKLKHSDNPNEVILFEVSNAFNNRNNLFDDILSNKPDASLALNNWLYEFGKSLWQHHLFQLKKYINEKWQQELYPVFNQNFNKKYPFSKNATVDVNLDDFTDFFGPHGTLANFYEKYIHPFYNTNKAVWLELSKHNSKLNFDKNIAETFIKSQLMQTMYFVNDKLSMQFYLTPSKLEPIVKKVELLINERKLIYKHHTRSTLLLEWPFKSQTVHLMFETIHHKQTSEILNSQWGLFKLLDKAKITPINKNKYQIIFKLSGNSVAFNIDTKKAINPLIKGIVENYQLPGSLFQ
ncbi:MAG: hypothetical protein HRT87_00830 [Legionellales bacterium]|nr:hypothetical protein [Legionellales bacterium]